MARQNSGDVRDASISIRTKRDLKTRLELEAQKSGRSLAQEIEARLYASLGEFDDDERVRAIVRDEFEKLTKQVANTRGENR